ncbi:MAG TPA: hypothetical protein VGM86_31870 [Thermoanaerobaculia bacterium]|jgi:hypothetical protein
MLASSLIGGGMSWWQAVLNPIWRGSTIGSHPLVWNAMLQHQSFALPPPGATSSNW